MKIVKLKDEIQKAKNELYGYQTGRKKIITTGRPWLDDIFPIVNGSVVTIAAASGIGKSTEVMKVENNIMDVNINPSAENFVSLNVSLEMRLFNIVLRGLAEKTNKKKSKIIREKFSEEELELVNEYFEAFSDDRRYISQVPTTPNKFFEEVEKFAQEHSDKESIIISCDHVALIGSDAGGSRNSTIEAFIERVNDLKMKYKNLIFLLVSQVNSDFLSRLKEKDIMSQPRPSDLYYSQFTFQISDYVIVIFSPYKYGIGEYTKVYPDRYPNLEPYFTSKDKKGRYSLETYGVLYFHLLKVREADEATYTDIYAEDLIIQGLQERREQLKKEREEAEKMEAPPDLDGLPDSDFDPLPALEPNEAFGDDEQPF